MKVCKNCGFFIDPKFKFCTHCGAKQEDYIEEAKEEVEEAPAMTEVVEESKPQVSKKSLIMGIIGTILGINSLYSFLVLFYGSDKVFSDATITDGLTAEEIQLIMQAWDISLAVVCGSLAIGSIILGSIGLRVKNGTRAGQIFTYISLSLGALAVAVILFCLFTK